jgi:hypothetical protein
MSGWASYAPHSMLWDAPMVRSEQQRRHECYRDDDRRRQEHVIHCLNERLILGEPHDYGL